MPTRDVYELTCPACGITVQFPIDQESWVTTLTTDKNGVGSITACTRPVAHACPASTETSAPGDYSP